MLETPDTRNSGSQNGLAIARPRGDRNRSAPSEHAPTSLCSHSLTQTPHLGPPQPPAMLVLLRSTAHLVHRKTVLLGRFAPCADCDCRAFGRIRSRRPRARCSRTPTFCGSPSASRGSSKTTCRWVITTFRCLITTCKYLKTTYGSLQENSTPTSTRYPVTTNSRRLCVPGPRPTAATRPSRR